jgi:hypothetical protein
VRNIVVIRFEQPGRLNRFLDGANALSRRAVFIEILPVAVFCAVTGVGMIAAIAFQHWIEGGPSRPPLWPRMLVAAVSCGALPFVLIAVKYFIPTKRSLELTHDRIKASSHKPMLSEPWNRVLQFEVEPIIDRDDLAKVSVTVALGAKKVLKRFSIVLDRAGQLDRMRADPSCRVIIPGSTSAK